MGDFGRFIVKRSLNIVIVLFSTLILTMTLLGPTMDKILLDATRSAVVEETIRSNIKFQNTEDRQNYIDQRIDLQIKIFATSNEALRPDISSSTILAAPGALGSSQGTNNKHQVSGDISAVNTGQ